MNVQQLVGLTELHYRVGDVIVNTNEIKNVIPCATGKANTAIVGSVEGHAWVAVFVIWVQAVEGLAGVNAMLFFQIFL
jgi:hypothetical protein